MNTDHQFRNTPFGGFNKEDVLKYIEQLKKELVEFRENEEKRTQELEKTVAHLQNQLTTARNAIDTVKKNNDELKLQNESLKRQLAYGKDTSVEGKEEVPRERIEEAQEMLGMKEQKPAGFKIEESVLSEIENSEFSKDDNEQPAETDYIDLPDNEKNDEILQKDDGAQGVQSDSVANEPVRENENNNTDTETETQNDEVELFKSEAEENNYVQDDDNSILKAQDSLRDLEVLLASAGFDVQDKSEKIEELTDDNEEDTSNEDALSEDDTLEDDDGETIDKITHQNEKNKEETQAKGESDFSRLNEFFKLNLSDDKDSAEIDDEEVDKLTDRFADEND